ncbi:MAG: C25 family cysteine peptidase, partial [Planctomycetaceae bacterium]|nr:C25 family cysteine peptidase [Planctomycetaceae bacterium]
MNFLRRFFLVTQFWLALIMGFVPSWGQTPSPQSPEVAELHQVSNPNPVRWNGESVAVICPTPFRKALEPWLYYRMNQGYKVYVLEEPKTKSDSEKTEVEKNSNAVPHVTPSFLKFRIRALAQKDPSLKYLLIIGDGAPELTSETTVASRLIPVPRVEALVVSSFGKEPEIATDNYYADLNDDNLPELAVGRLTADSPEELSVMIAKILRYESETDNGFWRRRINLVAGIGGFSPLIDNMVESTARYILSEMINEGYDLSLTQAMWKSAFCPDPKMFRSVTVERLNEGCLFWVYMGHGYHRALDALRTPDGTTYPIFIEGDSQYLDSRNGLPIAIFCACYTGAFDAIDDCLAEEMLRKKNGPVAIIASSRVSMPYGMAVFGVELIDEALNGKSLYTNIADDKTSQSGVKNIGTIFLNAKRNMLLSRSNDKNEKNDGRSQKRPIRAMIDSIAKLTDPTASRLQDQLIDHMHLFHLFGDPLLRIPFPEKIDIETPETVVCGNKITVRGQLNDAGNNAPAVAEPVVAELVLPRKRAVPTPAGRVPYKLTGQSREEYMKTYLATNNRSVQYAMGEVKDGKFEVSLPVPENISGEYS